MQLFVFEAHGLLQMDPAKDWHVTGRPQTVGELVLADAVFTLAPLVTMEHRMPTQALVSERQGFAHMDPATVWQSIGRPQTVSPPLLAGVGFPPFTIPQRVSTQAFALPRHGLLQVAPATVWQLTGFPHTLGSLLDCDDTMTGVLTIRHTWSMQAAALDKQSLVHTDPATAWHVTGWPQASGSLPIWLVAAAP